ncbi:MAG: twin-arginine translocation signal domain-containing protein, partial [Chloroflexi bacterium]|nr:twin-arginine translocation signal domain-containing protein [Chloroflexota bacterium]
MKRGISISRRDFLKLAGAGVAAAIFPAKTVSADTLFFGRPTTPVTVYEGPTWKSRQVGRKKFDEVVEVIGQSEGEGIYPHNNIWFQIAEGWVYSSFIQPCQWVINAPLVDVGAGKWGEVSIPIAHGASSPGGLGVTKLYYSEIHRVRWAQADAAGKIWYGLTNDDGATPFRWVPGEHVRIIGPEELTPISPDVTDKLIVVDRPAQVVTAFESGSPVYSARTSTGKRWPSGDYFTPPGEFLGVEKRMSKYMTGGAGSDRYGVTGVGFVFYFTGTKAATHSTYWHNNFGTPMS